MYPHYTRLKPTLGADPEFGLFKNRRWVSPHRTLPPAEQKLVFLSTGAIFRDGFSVELNPLPTYCRETLIYRVAYLLRQARQRTGARLFAPHCVPIGPQTLRGAPPDLFQAGCDPALSAYSNEIIRPEVDYLTHPFRYFGGHMHLSYPKQSKAPFHDQALGRAFIRLCDRYVGVPLTYLWACPGMFARREFYGRAGEFRFQNYGNREVVGIEYRTPGPEVWWTTWSASLAFGLFRWVATHFPALYAKHRRTTPGEHQAIQHAINTGEGLARWLPARQHYGSLGGISQRMFEQTRQLIRDSLLYRSNPRPAVQLQYPTSGWQTFSEDFFAYRHNDRIRRSLTAIRGRR